MCILELNKVLMYEFHYDYIKNKYDSESNLLFTDTDSLMYEIKTKDFYKDLTAIKKCLSLVSIHLSQNIMMIQTSESLEKQKMKLPVLPLKNLLD